MHLAVDEDKTVVCFNPCFSVLRYLSCYLQFMSLAQSTDMSHLPDCCQSTVEAAGSGQEA